MATNKARRSGLGRGMDALFTPIEADHSVEFEQVQEIDLSEIRPSPYQPRKHFDQEALEELAISIRQTGVFQPVILRKSAVKGYELVAGERRVRASRLAGLKTIPAIVRNLDEHVMIEIAVVENLQRANLNPMEEAEAYDMLMHKLDLTQAEVSERIGKSRPYVTNYLRLLTLPNDVKEMVSQGKLSMGHARTLLGLKQKENISQTAIMTIVKGLTVRELEEYVQASNEFSLNTGERPTKEKKVVEKPSYIVACEQRLQEYFGTHAVINQKGDRGKIEIEYLDESDLIRILDLLQIQI